MKPSLTKPSGGIYVESCRSNRLFPPNEVETWRSCYDAYETTWKYDIDQDLYGLSELNKYKLRTTMGFCPHMRCQLGNISSSQGSICPKGLCFTKLEEGSRAFGACCFHDEYFDSGDLFGYANKSQAVAKPIYNHSRIILDASNSMIPITSPSRFINANRVASQMVITQCPMANTMIDVQQMILQEQIHTWIQIAPRTLNISRTGRYQDCYLLSEFFETITYQRLPVVDSSENIEYLELDAKHLLIPNNDQNQNCQKNQIDQNNTTKRLVNFFWIQDWNDFDIPHPSQHHKLQQIVKFIVTSTIPNTTSYSSNSSSFSLPTIAINCLSGRGRSGTLAAWILTEQQTAKYHQQTVDDLVDLIVDLRRHRDGMVETPRQFAFITKMLQLSIVQKEEKVFLIVNKHDVSILLIGMLLGIFINMVIYYFLWKRYSPAKIR
jgi:protein tyrosine phosphatase